MSRRPNLAAELRRVLARHAVAFQTTRPRRWFVAIYDGARSFPVFPLDSPAFAAAVRTLFRRDTGRRLSPAALADVIGTVESSNGTPLLSRPQLRALTVLTTYRRTDALVLAFMLAAASAGLLERYHEHARRRRRRS